MPPARLIAPALALLLAGAAIALGACGGDDDSGEAAGGTTGPATAESAAGDAAAGIAVTEFIAELQPQKQEILEDVAAATPGCENVRVDGGFVLLVTAKALDADPDDPIGPIVEGEC